MNGHHGGQGLFGVVLLLVLQYGSPPIKADSRPNVVCIMIDDLNDWAGPFLPGVDASGQDWWPWVDQDNGNTFQTPNLDRLAALSVTFQQAYAAAPICNPSRMTILTGLRPCETRIFFNDAAWRTQLETYAPDAVTLPMLFRRNDYMTIGLGKIFHKEDQQTEAWDYYWRPSSAYPHIPQTLLPLNGLTGNSPQFDWGPVDSGIEEFGDLQVTRRAVEFLRAYDPARPGSRPFFMAVGLTMTHMPWYYPRDYAGSLPEYAVEFVRRAPVFDDDTGNDLLDVPPRALQELSHYGTDEDYYTLVKDEHERHWESGVQAYLISIAYIDDFLGRLLDAIPENTVIVFLSDHGLHFGPKLEWGQKGTLWMESLHVPLMIHAPNHAENQVCTQTTDLLNIYSTLAELCGLTGYSEAQGRQGASLVPLLLDPTGNTNWTARPAVASYGAWRNSIIFEGWQYTRYTNADPIGEEELYALADDPLTWTNLIDDPDARPDFEQTLSDLNCQLRNMLECFGDCVE